MLFYQARQIVGILMIPFAAAEDLFAFRVEHVGHRPRADVTEPPVHEATADDGMHAGMGPPQHL